MAFFGFGSPSFGVIDEGRPIMSFRQGSNELDRSCSRARSSPVMLSAAKHLAADRDRPFASLRVTWCDESNCQGLCFTIEPCLNCKLPPARNAFTGACRIIHHLQWQYQVP